MNINWKKFHDTIKANYEWHMRKHSNEKNPTKFF